MSEPPPPVPAPSAPPPPVLPPGVPDLGPPPPKRGLSTTAIVIIVLAAVFAIPCIAGLIGTISIIVPTMKAKQTRFQCTSNLSQLGGIFVVERASGAPMRSGPALFLGWRKDGAKIRPGQEAMLLCPLDVDALPPNGAEARALWDDIDLDDPEPGLCSYAVRDFEEFPLEEASTKLAPIAACLHHTEDGRNRGGAVVLFEDGSARFVDYEELGIADERELIVGPESKAELLRPLTFGPSEK